MLFFLLISLVLAKIYVYAPDTLQAKINQKYSTNSIPYSLANFGNPPYGSSIVSRVYWPEKQDERNGCKPLSPIEYMDDPHPLDLPILLLTRGMCSFTTKVRNAQNIGVVAVLIVDYVDEDVNKIILIDDGTAGNIFIPSMLISKADGQLIIDEIEKDNHSHVMLSLTFMMPKSKSKVYYDLWISSETSKTSNFLIEFSKYGKKLDNSVFNPHYALWYCSPCQEANYTISHPDCVSGGRYCAPDPDFSGPRTGKDIIMEDLRQICIHQLSMRYFDIEIWWNYINYFYQLCDKDFSERCAEKVMKRVKIDAFEIDECIENSFIGQKDYALDDNWMLKREKKLLQNSGIVYYPSIIINNVTYRGDLEADAVLKAICASYQNMPTVCSQLFPFPSHQKKSKVSIVTIFLITSLTFLLLITVLFLYKRWIKKELNSEMRYQVNAAVSQYIALTEISVSKE